MRFRNLFLTAFVILCFSGSVYADGSAAANNTPSFPHPAGSAFTPVTVPPTLPPVNSQAAAGESSAVTNENSAVESAVTQTQTQVNGVLNNTKTQQDLNTKTGTDTTYSGTAGAGQSAK